MFKTQGLQPKVAGLIHEPTVNFLVVFYNCKEGRDLTMRVDQLHFISYCEDSLVMKIYIQLEEDQTIHT